MKRIYFKNVKVEVFVDVFDSVLCKNKDSYSLCCDTNEQFNSLYDFFKRFIPELYTEDLEVFIPKKYIRRVVHVSTGSLAQLVKQRLRPKQRHDVVVKSCNPYKVVAPVRIWVSLLKLFKYIRTFNLESYYLDLYRFVIIFEQMKL